VAIEATSRDKTVRLQGASIGGGAIRITQVNGMAVQMTFSEDTLILFHRDSPGVLASIAHILSSNGYNIGNLRLSRIRREGDVITVVETDVPVDGATAGQLRSVESVSEAVVIPHF
jgi:L-serine dehydratase